MAKQRADAEERAARVVAHHEDVVVFDLDAVAVRARGWWDYPHGMHGAELALPPQKDGGAGAGPAFRNGKPDARTVLDFIRQHHGGFLLGRFKAGGRDDHRVVQIHGVGRGEHE